MLKIVLRKCASHSSRKHILKKRESESELEHQKYEKWALQLRCLTQTGIDGYEIYKNVGVIHAVVFADRA